MGCCEFAGYDRIKIIGAHYRQDSGPLTLARSQSDKFFGGINPVEREAPTAKSTLKEIERNSGEILDYSDSKILALPEISSYSSIQSWKAIDF